MENLERFRSKDNKEDQGFGRQAVQGKVKRPGPDTLELKEISRDMAAVFKYWKGFFKEG